MSEQDVAALERERRDTSWKRRRPVVLDAGYHGQQAQLVARVEQLERELARMRKGKVSA